MGLQQFLAAGAATVAINAAAQTYPPAELPRLPENQGPSAAQIERQREQADITAVHRFHANHMVKTFAGKAMCVELNNRNNNLPKITPTFVADTQNVAFTFNYGACGRVELSPTRELQETQRVGIGMTLQNPIQDLQREVARFTRNNMDRNQPVVNIAAAQQDFQRPTEAFMRQAGNVAALVTTRDFQGTLGSRAAFVEGNTATMELVRVPQWQVNRMTVLPAAPVQGGPR